MISQYIKVLIMNLISLMSTDQSNQVAAVHLTFKLMQQTLFTYCPSYTACLYSLTPKLEVKSTPACRTMSLKAHIHFHQSNLGQIGP